MKGSRRLSSFMVPCLFAGCLGSTATSFTPIPSPSGKLVLQTSVNQSKADATKYLCIKFEVHDTNGAKLGAVQTGASDTMRWAIGWFDDATIVLDSSDIGPVAWKLNADRSLSELPAPLTSKLRAFGEQTKAKKYGQ